MSFFLISCLLCRGLGALEPSLAFHAFLEVEALACFRPKEWQASDGEYDILLLGTPIAQSRRFRCLRGSQNEAERGQTVQNVGVGYGGRHP